MLTRRVPLFAVIPTIIAVAGTAAFFASRLVIQQPDKQPAVAAVAPITCEYNVTRLKGFDLIQPLLSVEQVCEAARFNDMKTDIAQTIDKFKQDGVIGSASVYVRDLRKPEWCAYDAEERYQPGFLLKISVLITYLRMIEVDHSLLNKKLVVPPYGRGDRAPVFTSKFAEAGRSYTIAELMELMIVYSDNKATSVLNQNMDVKTFKDAFTALGLPEPDLQAQQYEMTCKDYSMFMKALYNASFTSPELSEYAFALMERAEFAQGFRAGLPPDVRMAHKFGEAGDTVVKQLHESAVIYAADHPYLITVMTKGPNMDRLPEVLSSIARVVYGHMSRS